MTKLKSKTETANSTNTVLNVGADSKTKVDFKTIFDKTKNDDRWGYTRNEIIDRISSLTIDCPECENIIHSDEQYQCGTCGGGSRIFVLDWVKNQIENIR